MGAESSSDVGVRISQTSFLIWKAQAGWVWGEPRKENQGRVLQEVMFELRRQHQQDSPQRWSESHILPHHLTTTLSH